MAWMASPLDGGTPLQLASYRGQQEKVQLLIGFGAEVNEKRITLGPGCTALNLACLRGAGIPAASSSC